MKTIINNTIVEIKTTRIIRNNLANEILSFAEHHQGCDYCDIASWFGFDSDMQLTAYLDQWAPEISSLCPHDIDIILDNGDIFTIPQAGFIARCDNETYMEMKFGPIPIQHIGYGAVHNLPPRVDGVYYIVSRPVYEAAMNSSRGCADLFMVGETIREGGMVKGCKGLTQDISATMKDYAPLVNKSIDAPSH